MQVSKIFTVIDPTTPTQIALARAADIARGTKIDIHAYICIDENYGGVNDSTAMREAELARHEAWLAGLIRPLVDAGLSVTSEVECKDDWRAALAPAASRARADLIIKESRRRTPLQRRFLKTSDWMLLRNAECPVLLVKSLRQGPLTHVLAAINLNAHDEAHEALTDTVIDYSRALAEATGAELHGVNAYPDQLNFVHPPDLAKRLGIERARAHVIQGDPESVVAEVATTLGSPLVVISSVARKGMSAAIVGNTAERILDTLDCDILTIIRPPS